jgi:hypothetical protein
MVLRRRSGRISTRTPRHTRRHHRRRGKLRVHVLIRRNDTARPSGVRRALSRRQRDERIGVSRIRGTGSGEVGYDGRSAVCEVEAGEHTGEEGEGGFR